MNLSEPLYLAKTSTCINERQIFKLPGLAYPLLTTALMTSREERKMVEKAWANNLRIIFVCD